MGCDLVVNGVNMFVFVGLGVGCGHTDGCYLWHVVVQNEGEGIQNPISSSKMVRNLDGSKAGKGIKVDMSRVMMVRARSLRGH